ncbi:hypothetical protein PR202_gb28886 [Eleusine coracana subsp. coracana]|uniref:Bifunctional inhibitor/plant lipid transfer protein/seed storage helical domain-containing protein n=1 Tax=Eleusine coracana subsp. coracana TaxID=191504 RepID=A0AAV5FVK6_ELECO|nr:hypothetical protein PR202_gb28886 [Eleusine coracana subsp. coracana]
MKKGCGGRGGAAPAAVMVALAAVVVLAVAARLADGAVTCADVDSNLKPCIGYLTGKEAAPPGECCAGVKRLRTLPASTAERRQACECVKQAATRYQGLNADAVRATSPTTSAARRCLSRSASTSTAARKHSSVICITLMILQNLYVFTAER